MTRGRFITLEGGEGAGKSTQAGLLQARLEAAGHTAVVTREPGGAPGAVEIRRLLVEGAVDRWAPVSELLLHNAARHEHVRKTVAPALQAGTWVVCDRFADSTMAYQGYALGVDRDAVVAVNRLAASGVWPDLTVILDLPAGDGLARTDQRKNAEDRYERMGPDFHERIRSAFLEIAAADPARCVVVDARGAVDGVAAKVWDAVTARLKL